MADERAYLAHIRESAPYRQPASNRPAPASQEGGGQPDGTLVAAVELARLQWVNDPNDAREAMQVAADVGVAVERSRVVARLRREAGAEGTDVGMDRLLDIAAAIERGEHLDG